MFHFLEQGYISCHGCATFKNFTNGFQIRVCMQEKKFLFLNQTYVVGTQKNRLIEHPKQMLKLIDRIYSQFYVENLY